MLHTVLFTCILIALSLVSYYADDYFDNFEEEFLNLEGGMFSEHRSEIMMFVVPLFILLFIIYLYVNKKYENEIKRCNYTIKMTSEDYELNKELLTKQALINLKESPEFKQYLEDKKNGLIKEIELTDDDKIALSDDSSIMDEDDKKFK